MTDPTKAKIIELVPEIMELEFGCKVRVFINTIYTIVSGPSEGYPYEDGSYWATYGEPNEYRHGGYSLKKDDIAEVLGRPITLADVLRAIEAYQGDAMTEEGDAICITTDGGMWELKGAPVENSWTDYPYVGYWNLTLDYDGQTQEVKDFIGKLLGV